MKTVVPPFSGVIPKFNMRGAGGVLGFVRLGEREEGRRKGN